MHKFIISLLMCLSVQVTSANYGDTDTLSIIKVNDTLFKLKLIKAINNYPENNSLYLNNFKKKDLFISMQPKFTVKNDSIIIPLSFSTNRDNQYFYISNFPSIKKSIDTANFYNKISLGRLIGTLNKKGDIIYKFDFIDHDYLKNVNVKNIRKQFDSLNLDGTYANPYYLGDWDQQKFKNAYLLFEQITWLTILKQTFNSSEYSTLRKSLAPSLGPEYFMDFIYFNDFIKFIQN